MIQLTLTPKQAQAIADLLSFAGDQIAEADDSYNDAGLPVGIAETLPDASAVSDSLRSQLARRRAVLAGIANDYCDDLGGDK